MERTLRSILKQARAIQIEDPTAKEDGDQDLYYLIGGIIVNAEDAIGGLEAERESIRNWPFGHPRGVSIVGG